MRALLTAVGPLAVATAVFAAPATHGQGVVDDATARTLAVEEVRLSKLAGTPEQVGPLVALFELADLVPPDRLDGPVGALLANGATDPLVGARARDWLARRRDARGEAEAAERLRQPLGLLTRVWVVGPFGDGRASHGVAFPPEADPAEAGSPDPGRRYAGKERDVAWRRAEGAAFRGSLHLDALLRPASDAAGYLVAFVRSADATDAALRLGTPGPVKVWCNGALVLSQDRVRSARFDQDAVGVHLRAGWNRLLVKTVVTQGSWQVFARLTTPGGEPLSFVNDWTPAEETAPPSGPSSVVTMAAIPVRALEPLLVERTRRAGSRLQTAEAWLDLGRYLLAVDPSDRDVKAPARAFEAAVARTASVAALLGLAASSREDDERRRALERALAIAKSTTDRARILTALGDVARDQRREAAANELWRRAQTADPGYWPVALSLASAEQNAGLPWAALKRLEALPPGVGALPAVHRAIVRLLVAVDRPEDAAAELKTMLPDARDDVEIWRELGAFSWDRGNRAESLRALMVAATLRPDLPSLTVDWAREREGDGDVAGARAVLEAAARRMPDEFSFTAELGKLLDRHGELGEAVKWLRATMALRPQDVELRRYVDTAEARLQGRGQRTAHLQEPGLQEPGQKSGEERAGGGDDLARRFAASVPDLLAAEDARASVSAAGAPMASKTAAATSGAGMAAPRGEEDPAVVLLDRRVVRVHPNGLAETFSQRVTAIRTDVGARDNKEFFVRYTPGSEEVEIREARIFRRDAAGRWETLQSSGRDDEDLSEPWYGLYYDFRAEVVAFEGLRAGDVVDVEYVVSDVSRENLLGGYFGDLEFVAESLPKRRWDYTLIGPATRPFYFARPAIGRLTESVVEENGEKAYRFAASDVARIEAEPAMPGLGEVSPYLHVSTYRSWEEVGAWYWRLVEEQLVPDDTVRRAAAEALRPTPRGPLTELEKVRALHALVVAGTRYVGLEFGIHGFKPYKVSQVLSRRFGDCKDKAALLVVLLREAGIDAEMVLLRTRRGGRLAPLPASLAIFDHAIVFIPKMNLYLDGTAEFSGMDELPGQDQGVMVLRVGPHGAHLAETPVLPAARNRAARHWDVALKADGSADVRERLTLTGQAAPEWREHYQTRGEWSDRYGKALSARNPGARLLSVDMPGIEDRNRPVTVVAHASIPDLAEKTSGAGLRLSLGTHEVDLARTYARLSERRSPLVLGYPWQHDEQIVYQFPRRFALTHVPESRRIVSPFGSFDLQVRQEGAATVTVTGDLEVRRERVTAAEYPAFRRFLAEVDSAMAERITAAPETEAARAGTGAAASATP